MNNLLFSPAETNSKALFITLTVVRVVVALFFLTMAAKNLSGDVQMSEDFARWGYPSWFRGLTAVLQVVGAVLLLVPSVSFYGAALLCCIMLGAITTHWRHDPLATAISPAVFLAVISVLAVMYRPMMLR
jgi:uncharacterized membrane protein YphA (DoxX/SURF4 family)